MPELLDYALELATGPNHYLVFPCGDDKRPVITGYTPDKEHKPLYLKWSKWATCDPQEVRRLFSKWGGELVGIACAPEILAGDINNKDGRNGSSSFENLVQAYGGGALVEVGPSQATRNNGQHLLWRHPKIDIPQSHDSIADGVDIRSKGYICTGPGYTWLPEHGPHTKLTEAPGWFVDLILYVTHKQNGAVAGQAPQQYPPNADKWLRDALSMCQTGTRNNTGVWLACMLRDDGISEAEAMRVPYPEQVPQNGHRYERHEWEATVKSIFKTKKREPARRIGGIMSSSPVGQMASDSRTPPKSPQPIPEMGEAGGEGEPPEMPPFPEDYTAAPPAQAGEWVDKWKVFTLANAFEPREPRQWLVDGLHRIPSLAIDYGAPGSMKTLFDMYMSVCIAAGIDFLPPAPWAPGAHALKVTPGPVVWIDFDNDPDEVFERFAAIGRALKLDPASIPLYIYPMPDPWLKATEEAQIGDLIRRIKKLGAVLVTIDNLGAIRGDADENSSDMQHVMTHFRQLVSETRAVTKLIHHQRKTNAMGGREGDRLRGHSSIEQAVDLALLVERETLSDVISIKSTKTRSANIYPFQAQFTYTTKPGTFELETAMFYGLPGDDQESDRAIDREILALFAAPGTQLNKTSITNAVKGELAKVGINRIRDRVDVLVASKQLGEAQGGRNEKLYFRLA